MQKFVITIARGFGSGGKEIGVKLAERLGIPCYEQQILRMASESSGINEALFNLADEKIDIADKLKGLPFHYVVEPSDKRFTSNNNLFNINVPPRCFLYVFSNFIIHLITQATTCFCFIIVNIRD